MQITSVARRDLFKEFGYDMDDLDDRLYGIEQRLSNVDIFSRSDTDLLSFVGVRLLFQSRNEQKRAEASRNKRMVKRYT